MAAIVQFEPHETGTTLLKQEFYIEEATDGPVDLTDAIISIQMRTSLVGPIEKEFLSTNNGGITVTDAAGGTFEIDEQIINLPPFDYIGAVRITFPLEDPVRVEEPLIIKWPITKNANNG